MKTFLQALLLTALAIMAGLAATNANAAFNPAQDVPPQATPYLPTLSAVAKEVAPSIPPHYFGALIEHESGCPVYKSKCWNPASRLKTSREDAAGFGQLTRAYRKDGTLRFDALAETRKLDPVGLNELRWETIYQRPDLQMRAMLVMTRQNWNRLHAIAPNPTLRLQLTDLAYNAGLGRALNDTRACALTTGCNPSTWSGHIERTCTASRAPIAIYGNRSPCEISRHHVHDVVGVRMPKYQGRV